MSKIERLKAAIATAPNVPLGDLIEPVDNRNYDGNYSVEHLQGVTSEGVFDYSKAKTDGIDFTKYKIVKEGCFAYNPSRINLGSIALRKGEDCIISPMYIVFKTNTRGQDKLMPEFLYLWFMRPEFQRSTLFYASGSVRDTFGYNEMCRVSVPLPPIEVQQQYVDAYSGLRKLAEENEALLDPLSKACQACLSDARKKYTSVQLADYIDSVDNRNYDGYYSVDHLQGVTSDGVFNYSKAKTDGIDFTKYKIVKEGCFAYNPSRINLGSIALRKGEDCIISPMYIVFKVNTKGQNELMPEFLYLWFMRPEFQRSTLFYASGSVRDTFGYNEMCRVSIPLPPIEVQQSIVALHRCAEEARCIAAKARETLNSICPAMIQRATHEMH